MLAESGALGRGSMLPKVEAAARFAERGGIAVIAALADAAKALDGRAGTTVAVWPTPLPTRPCGRRTENPQRRFGGSADAATAGRRCSSETNQLRQKGRNMKLDRKDRKVSGLAILVVAVFVTTYAGWGVPLIGDSHRWATAVILVLGLAAGTLSAPGLESRSYVEAGS